MASCAGMASCAESEAKQQRAAFFSCLPVSVTRSMAGVTALQVSLLPQRVSHGHPRSVDQGCGPSTREGPSAQLLPIGCCCCCFESRLWRCNPSLPLARGFLFLGRGCTVLSTPRGPWPCGPYLLWRLLPFHVLLPHPGRPLHNLGASASQRRPRGGSSHGVAWRAAVGPSGVLPGKI